MGQRVLVVGGAGYIGSHMVQLLKENGDDIVVFDNLSEGHIEAIPGVELERGDLLNREDLDRVFRRHAFDAVIHFAALIAVGESVTKPARYYRNNVQGTLNLLDAIRDADVRNIVFSSTAAVFGNPVQDMIDESHPRAPISPYGWSKRMVEQILSDYHRAYGLNSVALRYFNASGAHPTAPIGEAHSPETHLIPIVLLTALGERARVSIFGNDYPTRDGTCIRDYIHVMDLASAHLKALDFMQRQPGAHAFNLGNGTGFTTLEVIEAAERITGRPIAREFTGRREGDPAKLVADSALARKHLEWEPRHTHLDAIVESAWTWHQAPSYGPFVKG